jgi:hypothetical protein
VGERVGFFPNRIEEEIGRITSGVCRVHLVLLDGMTGRTHPSVAKGGGVVTFRDGWLVGRGLLLWPGRNVSPWPDSNFLILFLFSFSIFFYYYLLKQHQINF